MFSAETFDEKHAAVCAHEDRATVSGQTGVAVSVEPRSELLRSYPALGLQGFLSRGIKPPDTHPFLAVSSSTTQHPH